VFKADLQIRLTPGPIRPTLGQTSVNCWVGGPETLLGWLETQLGLAKTAPLACQRITELVRALPDEPSLAFANSLRCDRWGAAAELLRRRDELELADWSQGTPEQFPAIARDLCAGPDLVELKFPSEGVRLHAVLAALESGQTLPAHVCTLYERIACWPALWQRVLGQLNVVAAAPSRCLAPEGTALREAQECLLHEHEMIMTPDQSVRWAATRSDAAACELVAQVLGNDPEATSGVVIYCDDDALAIRLDACLARRRLPTMGADGATAAHPIHQLLPLTLALAGQPVDPRLLLDFLNLPLGPLPRRAARSLAEALAREPGLGSTSWEAACAALCNPENDPDGRLAGLLERWVLGEKAPRGDELPVTLVDQRCRLVAEWALARAAGWPETDDRAEMFIETLRLVARHALLVAELAALAGTTISEPQLHRMYHEIAATALRVQPCRESAAGPRRVRSLAEIVAPCRRLIWLGVGTDRTCQTLWSPAERAQLAAARVAIDDGQQALQALRAAEARGVAQVTGDLLAIELPRDRERRAHPFWSALCNQWQAAQEAPLVVEDLLADDRLDRLQPFACRGELAPASAPLQRRAQWRAAPGALIERTTASATELQDRLGCPLKWTFRYQAGLRPSAMATLPESFQLKGTFSHRVLQLVLGAGGDLPTAARAAALVGETFDQRLPLDAAPLAQPDQAGECGRLRRELVKSARVLVEALHAGGYRIAAMEAPVEGSAFGKELKGSIDCVAVTSGGEEAVIDFKYAGRSKYAKLLETGRALQLATYAHSRRAKTPGGQTPAVAYLILADAHLVTPAGSRLRGGGVVVEGPSIDRVWQRFAQAITAADGWLTGAEPIPARPLQRSDEWPADADLALQAELGAYDRQEVCRYCDYSQLCGLEVLS